MHSIGIEHEGFAASGGSWYTEQMYQSSAKLVRYLAKKYNIPMDRQHIIGHDQFASISPQRNAQMHTDPGPYWDWDHYMRLLGAPVQQTAPNNSDVVTITPNFQQNKQTVTDCDDNNVCQTLPVQGANFVYLRTEPHQDAPLITDSALHPDGAAGTTLIEDTSAKAAFGQQYAVAGRMGDWTAIWFGGTKGWFYNPQNTTAKPTRAATITPKAGISSIPVYGRPVPEASAYKNGVPQQAAVPLQYKVLAGQKYTIYDKKAKNDYYHLLAFDRSSPGDGEIIVGKEKYLPISFGHRQAYVKASDVQVVWQ